MSHPEEIVTMECSHCGRLFNGSPKSQPLGVENFCSVQCEERGAPAPIDDPQSADFHLHVKANPETLVGTTIIANGLKWCDYSPDWHRNPSDYDNRQIVEVNEEEQTFIKEDEIVIGQVVDYGLDGYTIEKFALEDAEPTYRVVHDFLMVEQIRHNRWWVSP